MQDEQSAARQGLWGNVKEDLTAWKCRATLPERAVRAQSETEETVFINIDDSQ
jgi:hypothetical protein